MILDIYVDGSYCAKTSRAGWAWVGYYEDEEKFHGYGVIEGEPAKLRNIAGEMLAVIKSIKFCREHGFKASITYDYKGLKSWVGDLFDEVPWKTSTEWTQKYRDFMLKNKEHIDNMIWVKGHTGNKGNERADELAKFSLGIK